MGTKSMVKIVIGINDKNNLTYYDWIRSKDPALEDYKKFIFADRQNYIWNSKFNSSKYYLRRNLNLFDTCWTQGTKYYFPKLNDKELIERISKHL